MNYYGNYGLNYGYNPFLTAFSGIFTLLFIPLIVWAIFWKGWALWRAAKNDSKVWFVVLLVVNTLGILDILYLFVFGKRKVVKEPKRSSRK